jgi:hypothetical protein
MNKYFIFIVTLLFSSSLISQTDTTKVSFVAYWSLGDSYDFKVSKIKQEWKENQLKKDEKQEYIANFTVIDSTETSYTIRWTFENNLENTYKIPQELLDKFSKYKLTEIEYKTSELGEFIEILNWQQVSEIMMNMIDDIVEVLSEDDENKKETLTNAMNPLKSVYSSKEGIESIVLKELQYFHFPMGVEFDTTKPLFYEDELPNFFGGNPIKADAKLYFDKVDFEEGFCVLHQEMTLNPDDTITMLKDFFTQAKLNEDEMEKAMKTAEIKINDKNTYEYYFDPGVPHKIETHREAIININNEKGKRIEKTIIELIYYE